jgi:hypothetical protein
LARVDPIGHNDVVVAGDHAGGGEMNRLLTGSALPVDGDTGHGLRPARRQHRGARNVDGLLAGLRHAAPDHVVDERRIDPCLLDQTVEHLRGQVGGMHAGQAAVALADR